MLVGGHAEGADDVQKEGGVGFVEMIPGGFLGAGGAGGAGRAIGGAEDGKGKADVDHGLVADAALAGLELDLDKAGCGFADEAGDALGPALEAIGELGAVGFRGGFLDGDVFVFFERGVGELGEAVEFALEIGGREESEAEGFDEDFGEFGAVFGLAAALEADCLDDVGGVAVAGVVPDLPFEVMPFAERSFGGGDRFAFAIGGLRFGAHLAGDIGQGQADAHGALGGFDADGFVFHVRAAGGFQTGAETEAGEQGGGEEADGGMGAGGGSFHRVFLILGTEKDKVKRAAWRGRERLAWAEDGHGRRLGAWGDTAPDSDHRRAPLRRGVLSGRFVRFWRVGETD